MKFEQADIFAATIADSISPTRPGTSKYTAGISECHLRIGKRYSFLNHKGSHNQDLLRPILS